MSSKRGDHDDDGCLFGSRATADMASHSRFDISPWGLQGGSSGCKVGVGGTPSVARPETRGRAWSLLTTYDKITEIIILMQVAGQSE